MSYSLTINSVAINLVSTNTQIDRLLSHAKGGIPELQFSRLVGKLAALPDPWSGKAVTLELPTGTLVFTGDVVGYCDRYLNGTGWLREYRALGSVYRASDIPITDATSLTDTSVWNLPGDDPAFVGSRAGQTVGQIVGSILTMLTNATPLNANGLGAYVSMSPPTLPSLTVADLAALTVIPPWRVSISGDQILLNLEAFVQSCHPNHHLHVQPDGTIRFLDPRTYTPTTLTLGGDPRLDMPSLTRDYSDCYSQIEVRGNTRVQGVYLQTMPWPGSSLTDGGLQEDFAWGALSNAAAKAAWTPACWAQPYQNGVAADVGTCTCPSTSTITVTSSDPTAHWPANYWGQAAGESLGIVYVQADVLVGTLDEYTSRRIISNTALVAGGTSTLTLDLPLPATSFTGYKIWGLAQNCNLVGRKYKVTNTAVGAAMQNYFPYPVLFKNATGTSAAMTTTPMSQISHSASGSPPYDVAFAAMVIDPQAGLIYFSPPVQTIFGNPVWPSNVEVFVPVAVGTLAAYAPSSSTYAGTLSTVEGLNRRKTITVLEWRDEANAGTMATFASEFLDSVKDVVVEGMVPYHGLLSAYLTPGSSVSIAGSEGFGGPSYTTGYESLALPVVSVEVVFNNGPPGTSYDTFLHLSNRRGRYSAESFLRPNITGMAFGTEGAVMAAGAPVLGAGPAFTPETTGTVSPGMFDPYAESKAGLDQLYAGAGQEAGGGARLPFERLPAAERAGGGTGGRAAPPTEGERKEAAAYKDYEKGMEADRVAAKRDAEVRGGIERMSGGGQAEAKATAEYFAGAEADRRREQKDKATRSEVAKMFGENETIAGDTGE